MGVCVCVCVCVCQRWHVNANGAQSVVKGGFCDLCSPRACVGTGPMLRERHPIPEFDENIEFDPAKHTYTVRGKTVPVSVTKLISRDAVPPEHRFDGKAVILKNLRSWRANASSKYHPMVAEVGDEQAIENVLASWDKNRDAGTAMHAIFEDLLNKKCPASIKGHELEMAQFCAAMAEMEETPVRTELSIFANDAHGDAAVAGQIDLLTQDAEKNYHIVDFKRTATDLTPNANSYGKLFLDGRRLNDHFKYSLQLAVYSAMFELQTGKPIKSCRLLQIHPDLDDHQWIEATDLRDAARDLLRNAAVQL